MEYRTWNTGNRKLHSSNKFLIPGMLGLLILLGLALPQQTKAQQDFINGFYMYNPLAFNPAIVGVNDQMVFSGIVREQWTGLNGAPQTYYLNAHAPAYSWFDRYDRVNDRRYPTGLSGGVALAHDVIGPSLFTSLRIPAGYRIRLSQSGLRLSVGIRADVNHLAFDLNSLRSIDPGDVVQKDSPPATFLDVSTGIYLYHDLWYIGVSATNLREKDLTTEFGYQSVRHLYGSFGFALPLTRELTFRVTTLATVVKGTPFSGTISPSLIILDNIDVGASYRYDDMFGGHISFKAWPNLRIGYWYEYPMGVKTNEIGSTHEVMIQYTVDRFRRLVPSPRYFW